jgi:hypothetical protein
MKSKVSMSDDQHDHLLPENRDVDNRPEKGNPSRVANTQERYVGFGMGGAGNIRRFDFLSCVCTWVCGFDVSIKGKTAWGGYSSR